MIIDPALAVGDMHAGTDIAGIAARAGNNGDAIADAIGGARLVIGRRGGAEIASAGIKRTLVAWPECIQRVAVPDGIRGQHWVLAVIAVADLLGLAFPILP